VCSSDLDEVDRLLDFETPKNPDEKSLIAKLHARHEELHASAVATFGKKAKPDQPDGEKFDQQSLEVYRQTECEITVYRNTAKKVKLVAHVQLHRVMMRVIARLVDYAGLWERDLYFQSLAIMKLQQPKETHSDANALREWLKSDYLPIKLKTFFKQGKLPPETQTNQQGIMFNNYEPKFWQLLRRFHNPMARQTRNDLVHFNILRSDNNPLNLTSVIQATRNMMKYDRKLKNAVTKSVIEMMQQEGFELSWKLMGHDLDKVLIKSMDIHHLAFMQKQIGDWACDTKGLPKFIEVPKEKRNMSKSEKQNLWDKKREKKANIQQRKITSQNAQIKEFRHSLNYSKMVKALFE